MGTEALKIESTFVGYLLPNERVRMTSEMEGVIEAVNFEKKFLELLVLSGEFYEYYQIPEN